MGAKSFAAGILALLMEEGISKFLASLKKKAQRYAAAIIIATASSAAIIHGLGSILGSYFPQLPQGSGQVAVGAVFLLIGWAYARSASRA